MVAVLSVVNLILLLIIIGFLIAYLILGLKAWNFVKETVNTKIDGAVNTVSQAMRSLQL